MVNIFASCTFNISLSLYHHSTYCLKFHRLWWMQSGLRSIKLLFLPSKRKNSQLTMTLRMSVSKISTTNILAVFASNYGLLQCSIRDTKSGWLWRVVRSWRKRNSMLNVFKSFLTLLCLLRHANCLLDFDNNQLVRVR